MDVPLVDIVVCVSALYYIRFNCQPISDTEAVTVRKLSTTMLSKFMRCLLLENQRLLVWTYTEWISNTDIYESFVCAQMRTGLDVFAEQKEEWTVEKDTVNIIRTSEIHIRDN